MNNRTEQIIILKLQSGDADAYIDIYKQYAKPIYRYIYFRIGNEEQAEDLMQDVFLKFIEVADKERITKLKAYLYKIAKNLIIDFYREQAKVVKIDIAKMQELVSSLGQSATESRIELEMMGQAIIKLKDQWQELIFLRYIEGLEYEEMAEMLNKSENYIRVNLHRARKELNKLFKEKND